MDLKRIPRAFKPLAFNLYTTTFPMFRALGIHVVPRHYSWPIPDLTLLSDEYWSRPSEMVGVDLREQEQLRLLSEFRERFASEYNQLPRERTPVPHQYFVNNAMFRAADGEVLYCMVRYFRPRVILEVGSGNSTYLSAQALLKNQEEDGTAGELTAIEPYPSPILQQGFPGLTRLIRARVQDVPPAEFQKLRENDILFIDSSHMLKTGSDVEHLVLEVVPRLNRGVLVHFHDVYLPTPYPKHLIKKRYVFFNEQQVLQAFLCFNDCFEVLWASGFMHIYHSDELERAFRSYDRVSDYGGSFWIRRIK